MFDDIIDLEYSLPSKYHARAKFYIHKNNIKELRKIKDSQGRYIWQDAVGPKQPATLHGYTVVQNNWLAESKAKKNFALLKSFLINGEVQRWIIHTKQALAVQV